MAFDRKLKLFWLRFVCFISLLQNIEIILIKFCVLYFIIVLIPLLQYKP